MNINIRVSKYDHFILGIKTDTDIIIFGFLTRSNLDSMYKNYVATYKHFSYVITEYKHNHDIISRILKAFLEDYNGIHY